MFLRLTQIYANCCGIQEKSNFFALFENEKKNWKTISFFQQGLPLLYRRAMLEGNPTQELKAICLHFDKFKEQSVVKVWVNGWHFKSFWLKNNLQVYVIFLKECHFIKVLAPLFKDLEVTEDQSMPFVKVKEAENHSAVKLKLTTNILLWPQSIMHSNEPTNP